MSLNRPTDQRRWRGAVLCLVLIAATLGVYIQVLRFDFVLYDDPQFVTKSDLVRGGLTAQGIAGAFSGQGADYWRPISFLSHMLDSDLSRMFAPAPGIGAPEHPPELNPAVHHATSVVFHLVNTVLLFGLLHAMTGAMWRSVMVAALFALHPLRVESVVWVTERKDVLSMFFSLLAIRAYVAYARRPSIARYVLVAVLFAFGLMSKPMVVTLPLVFLLLDYWPLERLGSIPTGLRLLVEKLPLLLLSAACGVFTYVVQKDIGAAAGSDLIPLHLRVANALLSYVRYLGKAFWPADLTVYYPHMTLPGAAPWSGAGIVGAAGLLAVVTLAVLLARRHRYAPVGWFWYLGTLAPIIGVIQVGSQAMADRYTYVPMVGFYILLVWAAADLIERCPLKTPVFRAVAATVAVAILAALAIGSWRQARVWRDSVTLFENAVRIHPGDPRMRTNLGFAHQYAGRYDEAYTHYARAVELVPDFGLAYQYWGTGLMAQNEPEQASNRFRQALRHLPNSAVSHRELGRALGKMNRLDEAVEHFEAAIRIDPGDADAFTGLGIACRRLDRLDEAVRNLRRAVKIDPRHARAQQELGGLLFNRADSDAAINEALTHYRRALEVDPNHALTHRNVGVCLMELGRIDEAIGALRRSLQLNPDMSDARLELEKAMKMKISDGGASSSPGRRTPGAGEAP